MIKALGFVSAGRDVRLNLGDDYREAGKDLLQRYGIGGGRILVGMAPGATYGPAKRWYPDRFAGVSDRLHEEFNGETLLFGSKADHAVAEEVKKHAVYPVVNVAGQTSLKEAIALIAQCRLFISNDSGLMHVAGALGVPLVAVFGSTNPVTTSPVGEKSIIVTKGVSCSPCLKEKCDTDFRCMDLITADEVYEAAKGLLAPGL